MNTAWTCKACTWSNEDATTSCVMCQTFRPRCKFVAAVGGAGTSTSVPSAQANKPAAVAATLDDYNSDNGKVERQKSSSVVSTSQWDAFATLQSHYESSSDDESGDDHSEDDHDDEGRHFDDRESEGESDRGGGKTWDAFQSLQSHYQSSDESGTVSDNDVDDDRTSPPTAMLNSNRVEYIDLVHSDDEDANGNLHADSERGGKRRLNLVDSDDDPSTHNTQPGVGDKRRRKRLSCKATTNRKSPITLLDDSSISEEENSRPPPSSATRSCRSNGVLPPWQRSIPLHQNQILSGNKTLPSSSFSCMNGRNDVRGGSGAGVNGFQVSRTDDDEKRGSKKRSKEAGGAKKKTKSVNNGTENAQKPKKALPKDKKRYRRRGRSGKASKSGAKRVAQRRSTNDPWSAREQGIRQRNNRGRGTATSTYMMIGKQESALRSIGGASVTF